MQNKQILMKIEYMMKMTISFIKSETYKSRLIAKMKFLKEEICKILYQF